MATKLQQLIMETPKKDGLKPHNEAEKDKKGKIDGREREEKGGKVAP